MGRQRDNLADDWPALRTLTDLALRYWNVKLTCPKCAAARVMSGPGLWWLFHRRRWPDAIGDVKRRMYCMACRQRRRERIRPIIDKTKDAPTGAPLQLPGDHDWKKLIARYRS